MPVELFDLDEDARELYIVEQRRVVVYDMNTGAFSVAGAATAFRYRTSTTSRSRPMTGTPRRRRPM